MRHVTIAGKSLLVGDEVAATLVQYATLLGKLNSADNVTIRSIGVDGAQVDAVFLLNSGTVMMTESTVSRLPEPENADAVAYMQDRLQRYETYSFPDDESDLAD
jgi:hypothetical protein